MIRTGIIVAIIVFIGTLIFLFVVAPITPTSGITATSTSFVDKMSASSESTSTIRKIDATIVAKTSLFLNNILLKIADWLDSQHNNGALRNFQNKASTTMSNLICTPDSSNFVCDNGGDPNKAVELQVCGCMPKSCSTKQHIKVTSSTYDFWSNGTIKGRFECVDN